MNDKDSSNINDALAAINKILMDDYGFENSIKARKPVDKNHQPLPLYSYPVIEYLNSLDFNHKKIFEFGSGQSTLYWLSCGAQVVSVENDQKWIDLVGQKEHHQYIFASNDQYINSILQFTDHHFDVIVIDGIFSRYQCAKNCFNKIKKSGLIILDNSDWYPNTAKLIKEKTNFIQVDFYGFRPSRTNTSVTSLFFSREFDITAKNHRQPNYAWGGRNKNSKLDGE